MMQRFLFPLIATAILALPTSAAVVVPLNSTADGDGQFIDHFSAAFAIVDPTTIGLSAAAPNGMYAIGTTDLFAPIFAFNGGDWSNVGAITLSGTPTGLGIENFGITDGNFDFDQYISGADLSIGSNAYTTSLSNVTGSVELNNGVVDTINMNSDITFTFPGFTPFDGTLSIVNNAFTLDVDETIPEFGGVRQQWAFTGSVTAVPEPSSSSLLAIAGTTLVCHYRRRRKLSC